MKDFLTRKLNVRYAARLLRTLRTLFSDVVRRGERLDNPLAAVRMRRSSRHDPERVIPTKEDARALILIATTPAAAPPTFAEVWVGMTIFTGMRPSENRGAAIEDLELDGETPGVQIRRRADEWRQDRAPEETRSSRRFTPLSPRAVALLRRWLLVVPRGSGFKDPETGRQLHLLFPTSTGTVQTLPNIFNRIWAPLLTEAGLVQVERLLMSSGRPRCGPDGEHLIRWRPKYHVNSLRHLAASLMIEEGLDPKTIQQRLGHGSINMTFDVYGHLFAKREAGAASIARIEKKLLGEIKDTPH